MRPITSDNQTSYQFEGFELDPVRRVLLRDGKSIALKPKIFDTLLVLVKNSGRVMDKDEIMQQVWPDTIVEEVNLAHNISILRKVLGQRSDENRFIVTFPGKGYGFVAEVTQGQRNVLPSATVSEYELTRTRVVDDEEVSETGAGATPLPAQRPAGRIASALVSRPFALAATLVALAIAIALVLIVYRSRKHDT